MVAWYLFSLAISMPPYLSYIVVSSLLVCLCELLRGCLSTGEVGLRSFAISESTILVLVVFLPWRWCLLSFGDWAFGYLLWFQWSDLWTRLALVWASPLLVLTQDVTASYRLLSSAITISCTSDSWFSHSWLRCRMLSDSFQSSSQSLNSDLIYPTRHRIAAAENHLRQSLAIIVYSVSSWTWFLISWASRLLHSASSLDWNACCWSSYPLSSNWYHAGTDFERHLAGLEYRLFHPMVLCDRMVCQLFACRWCYCSCFGLFDLRYLSNSGHCSSRLPSTVSSTDHLPLPRVCVQCYCCSLTTEAYWSALIVILMAAHLPTCPSHRHIPALYSLTNRSSHASGIGWNQSLGHRWSGWFQICQSHSFIEETWTRVWTILFLWIDSGKCCSILTSIHEWF